MPIVLDTWALVAHLRDEPAAEQVRAAWLEDGAAMCSVNLGEALYLEMRSGGEEQADDTIEKVRRELDIVDPDWDLVTASAAIKSGGGLSYADAFCIATAQRLNTAVWTGDPEIVTAARKRGCAVHDLR